MKNTLRFFICMLFLHTASFSFASSVSIFMCQTDDASDSLRGATVMIENGVLEALFDRGHIVSSALAAKDTSGIDEASVQAFKNSAEGFFDFLVQITVHYNGISPENPAKIIFSDIRGIDWRIFRVKNKKSIAEKTQSVTIYEDETDVRALQRIAQEIGYAIEKVLQGVR